MCIPANSIWESGDDHGIFDSSVSLTEGMWNVIGHGRLYLDDDTFYPLEGASGCDGDTSALPSPWKLDFAIGLPHRVEPPLKVEDESTTSIEGWQIFVVLACVLAAVGVVYKFYKHYSSKETEIVRESAEEALKKALVFECSSLFISFGLATFDWVTDTMAMVTVQAVDDLNPMIVVAYFGLIIVITCLYFYVLYSSVKDILAVVNEYKNGLSDVVASTRGADEREQPLNRTKTGKISYEFTRVRRSITTEKIGGVMGLVEDLPMFVFNATLIFHYDITETALMISFITNAVILGYKFSGIERLWYLIQVKTKIDSMVHAVRLSRQLSTNNECSQITKNRLATMERALIDDEVAAEGDVEQGIVAVK